MARDTWALLGVFAAGFVLLAGMMLGVYDRLHARIESVDERLSAEIDAARIELRVDIQEVKAGQAAIRERLLRLEILVGVADHDLAPVVEEATGKAS